MTTSISYSYGTTTPTKPSGKWRLPTDATPVSAGVDLSKRWDAVAKKMNEDVKKLGGVWATWSQEPIIAPLVLSGIMSGLSFIIVLIAPFIQLTEDVTKIFIKIGILLSISAIVSMICGVFVGNHNQITGYNELNIPKEQLQYTGHDSWYRIGLSATGNSGGSAEVNASDVEGASDNNPYYFKVADNQTKIRVQVKTSHTAENAKTDKLAEANIIAVIGICSIIVIFVCVLLFSIIIFIGIKNHTMPHFTIRLYPTFINIFVHGLIGYTRWCRCRC